VKNLLIIAGLILLGWLLGGYQNSSAIHDYSGHPTLRDGDSFELEGFEIRLYGIDAPELHQTCERDGKEYDCGKQARRFLQKLIGNNLVNCIEEEIDRYDRIIAECSVNEKDIAAEIVRAGWAISYLSFASPYLKEEAEAEAEKRGLWAGDFEEPNEYRRNDPWKNFTFW